MAHVLNDQARLLERRQEWVARIRALVEQIAEWSQAEGWHVERHEKPLREDLLGEYQAPALAVRLPGGELQVNPIGLHVIGADGRIDLEALPTLSRVKLVGVPEGWKIVTDSNVPLRLPWTRETFVQLAHDLLG